MSNENKTATLTPVKFNPNLWYKIKVVPGIQNAQGTVLTIDKTQPTGFFTLNTTPTGGFKNPVVVANLNAPTFITGDSQGRMYVIARDASNQHTVYILNRDGNALGNILVHNPNGYTLYTYPSIALNASEDKLIVSGGDKNNLFFEFDIASGNFLRAFGERIPFVEPPQYASSATGSLWSAAFADNKVFGVSIETSSGFYYAPSVLEGFDYTTGTRTTTYDPFNFRNLASVTARHNDLLVGRSRSARISRADFFGNVLNDFIHPADGYYDALLGVSVDTTHNRIIGLAGRSPSTWELFVMDANGSYLRGANFSGLGLPANLSSFSTQVIHAPAGNPPYIFFSDVFGGKVWRVEYEP